MDGAFCFPNYGGAGFGFMPDLEYGETPGGVAEALKAAYPQGASWPESPLPATTEEEAEARRGGSCLHYGELHRDGLTRLLGPTGLDLVGLGARSFADLGGGRGHLALQAFLQFPQLDHVFSLELVATRHAAAVAAARRLAEAHPSRFTFDVAPDGGKEEEGREGAPASASLSEGARRCELRRADLWQLPPEELWAFGALLLNVLPPDGEPAAFAARLCGYLEAGCSHGCLLATSEDLHAHWRGLPPGGPPCCFRKLALSDGSFAHLASISAGVGLRTYGFLCDRQRPQCPESFERTPEEVEAALELAYVGRGKWQEDGLEATEDETEHAAAVGTSLTYGEVKPGGLTKLLGPSGLDLVGRGAVRLLELGSGRGRLALQAFLQFPGLREVVGVELVQSRHEVAVAALRRLAAASPGRWRLEASAEAVSLSEGEEGSGRRLQLRQGDFSELPAGLLEGADAVLLEVVLRHGPEAQAPHARLLGLLAERCRQGCVLAAYEDLLGLWEAELPGAPSCPFRRLGLCGTGFCTSWSDEGHNFHGFAFDWEGGSSQRAEQASGG